MRKVRCDSSLDESIESCSENCTERRSDKVDPMHRPESARRQCEVLSETNSPVVANEGPCNDSGTEGASRVEGSSSESH